MKAKKLDYHIQEFIKPQIGELRKVYRFKSEMYAGKAYHLWNIFAPLDFDPSVFGGYIRFKNEDGYVSVETTIFSNEYHFQKDVEERLNGRKLPKDNKVQRDAVEKLYSDELDQIDFRVIRKSQSNNKINIIEL